MRARAALSRMVLAVAALAGALAAQAVQALPPRTSGPALDGLPELPPLTATSPRDTLLFADRFTVAPSQIAMSQAGPTTGQLITATVPAAETGTGKNELIQYLVPANYDPAHPVPLLVAWHGYGSSAAGVSQQTTLDEECNTRGWAYLAVTGIDDKLFGTPLVQQNVVAAIAWLQQRIGIDPTRIYGVGFSMGAGCIASFAARHRDPAGPVFAGLGLVCGSFDWTQTWWIETAMRSWLENVWNFGAPPAVAPFAYRRVSDLCFDPFSYPPTPGTLLPDQSMAQNLDATPAWITWDTGDTLTYLPAQSGELAAFLGSLGDTVQSHPVSGTVDPSTGQPAPHSWAVMDAHALCDFLAPLSATLRPDTVRALVDERRAVSWMTVAPADDLAFAAAQGTAAPDGTSFDVHDVSGASRVLATPTFAAPWTLSGAPGAAAYALGITGVQPPAGWGEDPPGQVSPQFTFDPAGDGLLLTVTQAASWTVQAHAWDASFTISPEPAVPGSQVHLHVDAAPGANVAWLVAGLNTGTQDFGGGHILLVMPTPPVLIVPVPLDAGGDISFQSTLPKDTALSGAWLLLQVVAQGPGPALSGSSNPFRFDVQ